MEWHKRVGITTITVAILLAMLSVVVSESQCYADAPAAQSVLQWLLVCLRIKLFDDLLDFDIASAIYVSTKYVLMGCFTLFALGVLWYKNVLPVPRMPEKARASASPHEEP